MSKKKKLPEKTISSSSSLLETVTQNLAFWLRLRGSPPGAGEWRVLVVFHGHVLLNGKWLNDATMEVTDLSLDLGDPSCRAAVTERPLTILLRSSGGKPQKDPDALVHTDNYAGASVDLYPLLIGEEKIFVKLPLVKMDTGAATQCRVEVRAYIASEAPPPADATTVPLLMTLLSARCLPVARDGTGYIAALGLDGVLDPSGVSFGMCASSAGASHAVWAAASSGGHAADTAYRLPADDAYIARDLTPKDANECQAAHWNAFERASVDPDLLRERLSSPLVLEVAGVPKAGKSEVRGRFVALVDARVLLEPGQRGVTVCSPLWHYDERLVPPHVGKLLDLAPSSAKQSARDAAGAQLRDELGHETYVLLRLDLNDPLVPKIKKRTLLASIVGSTSESSLAKDRRPPPEEEFLDAKTLRAQGGALAVHQELSQFTVRSTEPMSQGIKRSAANALLLRVRSVLKRFPPGPCSAAERQHVVTAQHAAARRALAASFAPRPARGDSLKSKSAEDVGTIIREAVRRLEDGDRTGAKKNILRGINVFSKNRYLLWLLGGVGVDEEDEDGWEAAAALHVAVPGDRSEGAAGAVSWAALHALHHRNHAEPAAFVAARNMRKCFELAARWPEFLRHWTEESGRRESWWSPEHVSPHDPVLQAAAHFLRLRCYALTERLLQCAELGCATRGARRPARRAPDADVQYVRAAALLLQGRRQEALEVVERATAECGPVAALLRARAACLAARGWDAAGEAALAAAERAGGTGCPAVLLWAARADLHARPRRALQRAARAHRASPSADSALLLAQIHGELKEWRCARRWAAAAVAAEPALAAGWAFLAALSARAQHAKQARALWSTARVAGARDEDIADELAPALRKLCQPPPADALLEDLCVCDYC